MARRRTDPAAAAAPELLPVEVLELDSLPIGEGIARRRAREAWYSARGLATDYQARRRIEAASYSAHGIERQDPRLLLLKAAIEREEARPMTQKKPITADDDQAGL